MAHKIIVSPRAQQEIEKAVDYYLSHDKQTSARFIESLKRAYASLQINPYYQIKYKNIRAFAMDRYPYALFFVINEQEKIVRILSCFHNKRHPRNRPSY